MKELYVCEKCGAQYESWDDAYKCENGHAWFSDSTLYQPEVVNRAVYKPGEELPAEIVMCVEAWTYNEESGERERVYRYVRYGIKKELTGKDADPIHAERKAREEKEEADRERWAKEWQEEQERKKAKAEQEAG